MLRSLKLENFKSFKNSTMELGSLTVLVGTNASGKSNIRDALRFLHGIGRGYSLAEILGEKWGEGGILEWNGIRGGLREAAFAGTRRFAVEVAFDSIDSDGHPHPTEYRIEVDVGRTDRVPRVVFETLVFSGSVIYEARQSERRIATYVQAKVGLSDSHFDDRRPVLSQLIEHPEFGLAPSSGDARLSRRWLAKMRFLDLNPDSMRLPSVPGLTVLGDRGENLSSVLQAICYDPEYQQALVQWLRELTPMDVVDFEFPSDQTGRVLLTLVEKSGRRVSAYSASDGTLRFLAMLAALLAPESAGFYFFEELENGLHPTRLALLLELIEQQTAKAKLQVVATTHSAQLLSLLSPDSQSRVIESYRREDSDATDLTPVVSLPDAQRVIAEQGLGRLHASGWIEDAVAFAAPEGD